MVGAAGLTAGCGLGSDGEGGDGTPTVASVASVGNYPVEGDTATFGLTVPRTGPYQPEGESELRGYELAVKDLNNGRGWVGMSAFSDLSGDGLLGKTVDSVAIDTETSEERARAAAEGLIDDENVIMFTGGSSSAVAVELQRLAQERQVIYMACLSHANATTGSGCARYAFRMMFDAEMSAAALVPVLTSEFGVSVSFYQLYADYNWGQNLQESLRNRFEAQGWYEIDSAPTRLGRNDYRSDLRAAREEDPDVVFLNQFGLDGATILRQADEILGDGTEIVLPLYDQAMADLASDAIPGVYGTVAWDSSVDTTLSIRFIEHFQEEYDRLPAGTAYLAYAQTLLYASSVARVGTFDPVDVIDDLEGRVYQSGLGEETVRACDHQSIRPVPVARGLPQGEQSDGNYFEVVDLVDDAAGGCQEPPASECELGPVE